MTKKIIIPLAAVVAAIAAAICVIAFKPNNAAADKPEPPAEIPSGTYYLDGNPENDELCIVVDGGNIRFQSDDLREAFKAIDLEFNPDLADNSEALKSQLDADMEDWGADSYSYKTKWFPGTSDYFMVMFNISENEDGTLWGGRGFKYYPDTKTLDSWAGDFILSE